MSKFQISSPSVPWFPRSVAVFLLLILYDFSSFLPCDFLLRFYSQTQPLSPHCCLYKMQLGSIGSGIVLLPILFMFSWPPYGHRCAHSSSKGKMNLLIIFAEQGLMQEGWNLSDICHRKRTQEDLQASKPPRSRPEEAGLHSINAD